VRGSQTADCAYHHESRAADCAHRCEPRDVVRPDPPSSSRSFFPKSHDPDRPCVSILSLLCEIPRKKQEICVHWGGIPFNYLLLQPLHRPSIIPAYRECSSKGVFSPHYRIPGGDVLAAATAHLQGGVLSQGRRVPRSHHQSWSMGPVEFDTQTSAHPGGVLPLRLLPFSGHFPLSPKGGQCKRGRRSHTRLLPITPMLLLYVKYP